MWCLRNLLKRSKEWPHLKKTGKGEISRGALPKVNIATPLIPPFWQRENSLRVILPLLETKG